jgi:hypothetical protein
VDETTSSDDESWEKLKVHDEKLKDKKWINYNQRTPFDK